MCYIETYILIKNYRRTDRHVNRPAQNRDENKQRNKWKCRKGLLRNVSKLHEN